MLFNIPQFIDIEDKIVGPLTAKQLGWLAAGGVGMLLCWSMLDFSAFIMCAVFIGIVFGGLAFYRPNGQPLVSSVGSIFVFFFKPKMYIWKRVPSKKDLAPHEKIFNANATLPHRKEITIEEIERVSQLLEIKKN